MAILSEQVGDVLEAPPNSIIMRTDLDASTQISMLILFSDSCNAVGLWGKGVAEELRHKVSVLAAPKLRTRARPR